MNKKEFHENFTISFFAGIVGGMAVYLATTKTFIDALIPFFILFLVCYFFARRICIKENNSELKY